MEDNYVPKIPVDGAREDGGRSDRFPSKEASPTAKDEKTHGRTTAMAPSIPPDQDLMLLSRLGEIGAIQKLFDAGKYDATYKDEQGVTPLHWAAMKNHYALCHFLIQSGADVNAAGGDVGATPVLWAARACNYYVVNLLLQHGADPLRTDNQGFNLLQNATLDGNVYQVFLLLYQEVPVDTPDPQGHTSLMWAAYKGFPACVEALLRFGASVNATDELGFTALHWGLVKGSQDCIQKLIEYGSDRFLATTNGKTPAVVAREMNSKRQWFGALSNCGYDGKGNQRQFPLGSLVQDRYTFLARCFFFWPFIIIFCCFYIVSGMPIYAGAPIALLTAGVLQALAGSQKILQWNPSHKRSLPHTSYLAGVFAGSLFWVGVRWATHILPQTFSIAPFLNLSFAFLYSLCTYFYILSMFADPGWVPKPASRAQERAIVQELIDSQDFNEKTFCTSCLLRKPLRSKHCKRCQRCVAREDHHCPWINNCVAVNNHRQFFLYTLTMELGIISFILLTFKYLVSLPTPTITTCNVLSDELCTLYNKDPFTIVVGLWATLQLTWVTMLVVVQFVQVSRGQTTYEVMRGHQHMSKPEAAVTSALISGAPSLDDAGLTERSLGNDSPPSTQPRRRQGFFDSWKRLLGIDTFVATAMHGSRSPQARQTRNPFSRGIITNLKDFFFDSGPLLRRRENGMAKLGGQRIDYTRLYDIPARSLTRSERHDDSEATHLHVDPGERE